MTQTLEITIPELLKKWNLGQIPASAKVSITYDDVGGTPPRALTPIYYGMFKGDFPDLSLEDCKIAEYHGDPDDGLDGTK